MKTVKALVIDDDENSRLMAQYCLFQLNCDCDTASGGEEALAFVSRQHYDLIFIDWNSKHVSPHKQLIAFKKYIDLVRKEFKEAS